MGLFEKLKETDMIAVLEREMASLCEGKSKENQRIIRVAEGDENDPSAWFDMGMGDIDKALRYEDLAFECARLKYFQEHPEAEEATLNVEVPELADFYNNALACFDHVLQLDPEYYGIHCQRGICYANMHDNEHAEAAFLQALKDDDEDSNAAYNLALLYEDWGKDDKAAEYFTLAQKLQDE